MLSNMKYIVVIIAINFLVLIGGEQCDNCGDTKHDKLILNNMDGYEEYNNHFYKVFTNSVNWETARKHCENEHAYLAIINSNEEAQFVRRLVINMWSRGMDYPGVWVGIHDLDGNANWRTIKDDSLDDAGYNTWWIPSQRQIKNQCGTVKICGRYAAMPCDNNLLFVCEMEIATVAVN